MFHQSKNSLPYHASSRVAASHEYFFQFFDGWFPIPLVPGTVEFEQADNLRCRAAVRFEIQPPTIPGRHLQTGGMV